MDGLEFLARLRARGFGLIPVVALSGEDGDQAVARTVEAGFAGRLLKPVTREAICAQVHRAVRCRV
jgi:CheY-like chemotaxis protein